MNTQHNLTAAVPAMPQLAPMSIGQVAEAMSRLHPQVRVEACNWPELFPARPQVSVALAHTDRTLYMRFDVCGEGLKAVCLHDNEPVWQDSAVEFFCRQPDGGDEYRNFEFNCIGTALAAVRRGRDLDVRHFPAEQMSRIERHASTPHALLPERPGTHSWSLTVGIPFDLTGAADGVMPRQLRCNFYKCADETAQPHYLSWNPIPLPSPDFHCPQFFGTLVME